MGRPGEPIAELTKFGWIIASPEEETGVTNMLFSTISLHDYEKFCSLDCLGIKRDVMIVIMFTRNFKNSWGVNLGNFMKRI